MNIFLLCGLIVLGVVYESHADRTSQKIYYNVADNAYAMCFRRFNGTHQIGCSSERSGNVGTLHYIEKQSHLDWLVKNGTHSPYIVLLTRKMFSRNTVDDLKTSGKVNGVLIIHTANSSEEFIEDVESNFSPDLKCPNEHHDLYTDDKTYGHCKNNTWNNEASELFFDDSSELPYAVLLNATDVNFLIETCYEGFNKPGPDLLPKPYPVCSVQLKIAMDGAKDTPTCIRRSQNQINLNPQSYCDPLGGLNAYAPLEPIASNVALENDSIILITARMDSSSMFDKLYPGADTAISSFVTLLAVAEAIGKVKNDIKSDSKKKVLFAVFNGEAFDYMGSTRMVYDMMRGDFPAYSNQGNATPHQIDITHIDSIIEISQVGLPQDGKLWIHTDPISLRDSAIKTKVDELTSKLKEKSPAMMSTPEVQALPPASLQSFLKKRKIPGIVIADHDKHFSNRFYNSRFELKETINMTYKGVPAEEKYDHITPAAENLAIVASAIAKTVYELATEQSASLAVEAKLEANSTTITHMLYCYAKSPGCELFNYTLNAAEAKKFTTNSTAFSLYVGVQQGSSRTLDFRTHTIMNLLSYFLGDIESDLNETTCTDKYQNNALYTYSYVNGAVNASSETKERLGLCLKGTSNHSLARSPAFDIENYDWSSQEYSAWTESRWATDAFKIRSFLVPSRQQELTTLLVGISLVIVCMPMAYFINKRAPILFAKTGTRTPLLQQE